MSRRSRRGFLASAAAGIAVAGCLGRLDDGELPPVGVDDDDVDRILAAEVPTTEPDIPVGIDPDHIERGVERVEGLLDWDPDEVVDEIPNEAVRKYIESERETAEDRLEQVAETATPYARLRPLRRARSSAAEAAGALAAAREARERSDVYAEIGPAADRLQELRGDLAYVGENGATALVVYDAIERRLDNVDSRLERAVSQPRLASEVEAVGDASRWFERAKVGLDDATHILQRQGDAANGDRSFEETFENAARDLRSDHEARLAGLPSLEDEPANLFDARVEGTPRGQAAFDIIRGLHNQPETVQRRLDEGRPAEAVMRAYLGEYRLGAADRLVERVEAGELARPENADAVVAEREAAIGAIEDARRDAEYPYLVRGQLEIIDSLIVRADNGLRRGRNPDSEAVRAAGSYAAAAALVYALPNATERIVQAVTCARR